MCGIAAEVSKQYVNQSRFVTCCMRVSTVMLYQQVDLQQAPKQAAFNTTYARQSHSTLQVTLSPDIASNRHILTRPWTKLVLHSSNNSTWHAGGTGIVMTSACDCHFWLQNIRKAGRSFTMSTDKSMTYIMIPSVIKSTNARRWAVNVL